MKDMEAFAQNHVAARENQVFDIKMLAMFCVVMRKAIIDQVGPLDERFGVGLFEDDDYARRVHQAGYRVICAEDVFVHHYGRASFNKLSAEEYQGIFELNQRLYEAKWGGAWVPHKNRA
jgi:GT2 family glycosyltransferase